MRFADPNILRYAMVRDPGEAPKGKRANEIVAPGYGEVLSEDLDTDTDYDGVRVVNPFAGL